MDENGVKSSNDKQVMSPSGKSHHHPANRDSGKHGRKDRHSTEGSSSQHEEDAKAKERARRPRSSKSPTRPSTRPSKNAKDRASKDRARRSRSPVPGAESVSRSSPHSPTRSEKDAKRRTRRSEKASKPGAESVGGIDRIGDAKASDKKGGSSKLAMAPGMESLSEETDNRTRRENRKAGRKQAMSGTTKKSSKEESHKQHILDKEEPAREVGGDDIPIAAIAVDDDDKNVQVGMDTQRQQAMMANGASEIEGANNEVVPDQKRTIFSKRNICILVVLLLAIGGGVAGYILSQSSNDAAVESTGDDGTTTTDDQQDTDNLSGTPSTSPSLVPTEALSTSPTTIYSPPSDEDCDALRNGQPIDLGDQEYRELVFQIEMDVVLEESKDSTAGMEELVGRTQSVIVPILVGCPEVSRRNLIETTQSIRRGGRRLLKKFEIAGATFKLEEDGNLSCVTTDSELPCYRPVVNLKVFVKGDGKIIEILGVISQALEANSGLTTLLEKLGLIDEGFVSILNIFIGDRNKTDPPSSEPSSTPSAMPSSSPSAIASANPTFAPQTEPTASPSMQPSTATSQGPTNTPTVTGSGSPTLSAVVGPSPPPSNMPSTMPSVIPSVMPSNLPSFLPTHIPSVVLSGTPSTDPSLNPSSDPSASPSTMPSRTPSRVPSPAPSENPSITPSMSPTVEVGPILMDIYNAAGGSFGSSSTGWQGTGDWCTWDYVECDSNREVTTLNIAYLGSSLSGTISPRIADLTSLATLILSGNRLGGTIPSLPTSLVYVNFEANNLLAGSIPASFYSLPNLIRAEFAVNQLTGSISSLIGGMPKLNRLVLYRNQLTNTLPPELGNVANLRHLVIRDNQFNGSLPSELFALTAMTRIDVQRSSLTGSIPTQLSGLTELTRLDLDNNQLVGNLPAGMEAMTKLTWLRVHNNQMTGTIPPLKSGGNTFGVCDLSNNNFDDTTNAALAGCGV
ncbi:unnamed protein product [Cylindrotheca closterium]|uniref:Leucine-rich repeat-containing N-terminal plant-type domain-containing protein n=1 Tax=Cylindrotheca closterium TaxID=2856 RepID=A0AAD2G3F0_9STRA|nr:unnamed protein product [Cylindrotheca closterium]